MRVTLAFRLFLASNVGGIDMKSFNIVLKLLPVVLAASAYAGNGPLKKTCMFPHPKNVLQVTSINSTANDSIDPGLSYTSEGWNLLNNTCAKLFTYPESNAATNLTPIAEVANLTPAEIAALGSQTTLTIPIKKSFKFSDNSKVTAASFIQAITRARALDNNAGGYYEVISSMSANAQGALVINLTQPTPDIVQRLTLMFACAVPANTPMTAQNNTPIPMAGRYYFASVTSNNGAYQSGLTYSSIVLKQNPHYKGNRTANAREIHFNFTPGVNPAAESQAVYADFLAGCSDFVGVGNAEQQLLSVNNPNEWFTLPTLNTQIYELNQDSGRVFGDCPITRKAVAYAIDRTIIANQNPLGDAIVGSEYLPPGVAGYDPAEPFNATADLLTAAPLVASSGCANKPIIIPSRTFASNPVSFNRNTQLATMLTNAGFTNVTVVPLSRANYNHTIFVTRDWDIGPLGWNADYPDPVTFLNPLMLTGQFFNIGNFSGRDTDLLSTANLAGSARTTGYHDLSRALSTGVATGGFAASPSFPYIVWGYGIGHDPVNTRVQCSTLTPYPFIYNQVTGIDLGSLCVHPDDEPTDD
jgi:ABC-type oligopeptide transport system substrate-binding subunit